MMLVSPPFFTRNNSPHIFTLEEMFAEAAPHRKRIVKKKERTFNSGFFKFPPLRKLIERNKGPTLLLSLLQYL